MYYKIIGTNIEIFMSSYAMTVDEGRRTFARFPKGFAKDILQWMSIKGINPQNGKTRMESAKAIAQSIYEQGTIKRFGYSGSNFIDRAVNNVINEFDDDLLTAWISGLEEELNKIKKQMAKINVRSPYFINVSDSNLASAKLEVEIFTWTQHILQGIRYSYLCTYFYSSR